MGSSLAERQDWDGHACDLDACDLDEWGRSFDDDVELECLAGTQERTNVKRPRRDLLYYVY